MSVALRKVAGHAKKCDCAIIFINQLRYKVSIRPMMPTRAPLRQDSPPFTDMSLCTLVAA